MPVYLTAKSLIVYMFTIDTDDRCFQLKLDSRCMSNQLQSCWKIDINIVLFTRNTTHYLLHFSFFVVILTDFNNIFNDRVAEWENSESQHGWIAACKDHIKRVHWQSVSRSCYRNVPYHLPL